MATVLKLRGLDRGTAAGDAGSSLRGFRLPSAYGRAYAGGVKATATAGATTSALTVTARYGGTWANGHTVNVSQAGSGTGTVTVTYAATTGVPTFVVTGGAGMTSANAATALNAFPAFASLYTATGAGAGTTLVNPGALAGGTNVGTSEPLYTSVSNKSTTVVDIDDSTTMKLLRRNAGRYISLGLA